MNIAVYILDIIIYIGIFSIVAISLNLEYGFTGLGNFGKVAFFLIGAYTYAILSQAGVPFYLCLICGGIIAAIGGLIISLPALRLREDYLAIVTLTVGEILRLIVKTESGIGGGVWGISVKRAISISFPAGFSAINKTVINAGVQIVLIFGILALCFIVLQLLTRSPYGRIMRALRDNELATESLGKSRAKYKAQVFMLGSAIAGIAGGLFAQYIRFIDPYMFMPIVTFTVWIMSLVGGPANFTGALLGATLVQIFDRGTNILKDYITLPIDPVNLQYILFGVLILLVLFFRPQGLLRESKFTTRPLKLVYEKRRSDTSNKKS